MATLLVCLVIVFALVGAARLISEQYVQIKISHKFLKGLGAGWKGYLKHLVVPALFDVLLVAIALTVAVILIRGLI